MKKETKKKIEDELRGEDFVSGDYLQSLNPRREKFAKLYGEDSSSDSSSSKTRTESESSEKSESSEGSESSEKTSKTQKK